MKPVDIREDIWGKALIQVLSAIATRVRDKTRRQFGGYDLGVLQAQCRRHICQAAEGSYYEVRHKRP